MFFDLRPKERAKDLFGREKELKELGDLVETEWVAVVGARMTGKTSLIRTFVRESRNRIALYVNLLGARGIQDFALRLSEALGGSKTLSREVSLRLPFLEVTKSSEAVEGIFSQLRGLKKDLVVALDETQELYRVSGRFLKLLKMIHDTYPRVRFIFTGSMFGLMRTLLRPSASSPMYGRKPARIDLKPFDERLSRDFLRKGFKEFGMSVGNDELEEVVGALNGYVGWLTYHGNFRCARKIGRERALEEVISEGKKLIGTELQSFLEGRDKKAYMTTLRAAALGARWSEIKRALERKFGWFNNKRLSDILRVLETSMLVEKRGDLYIVPDPIMRRKVLD